MQETKLLTSETWPDFEILFEKHRGVRGGCWCTFHQCSSGDYNKMTKDERRLYHQSRVIDGQSTGILLYEQHVTIGWCQFGPAKSFEQINRNRAYKALAISEQQDPIWRITCIFVDRDYRRRGLSEQLLIAALNAIRSKGGGIVESFPLVVPQVSGPQYTGSVDLYRRLGFAMVGMVGKSTALMRKEEKQTR